MDSSHFSSVPVSLYLKLKRKSKTHTQAEREKDGEEKREKRKEMERMCKESSQIHCCEESFWAMCIHCSFTCDFFKNSQYIPTVFSIFGKSTFIEIWLKYFSHLISKPDIPLIIACRSPIPTNTTRTAAQS